MTSGRPRRDTANSPYVDIRLRLSKEAYDKIQHEKSRYPNIPLGEISSLRILGHVQNKFMDIQKSDVDNDITFGFDKEHLHEILERINQNGIYILHVDSFENLFIANNSHLIEIDMFGTPYSAGTMDTYSNCIISVRSSCPSSKEIIQYIENNNCDFIITTDENDGTVNISKIFSIVGSDPESIIIKFIDEFFCRISTIMPNRTPLPISD